MENLYDLLNKIKSGEVNIAQLAKDTAIPATRMYKWKDRDSDISYEDGKKLENWLIKLDNSQIQKSELEHKSIGDKDSTIYNLSEANIILAKATLILAEKISSGESGSAPLPGQDEQKDNGPDPLDANLSGRKKPIGKGPKKGKTKGILKNAGK